MTEKINTKIKIPSEWYAGFTKSKTGLPVVYMAPNGTDVASSKRINTVKRYSGGEHGIPDTVLPNTPVCGFKILKNQSGGYNTGSIVWRIEDPRGFQSEIPSGNLNQLLALTTIDHGEILESCVWARDGKDNVLLPTNSEEYKTAVKNTELAMKSVKINSLKIGNIVNLKNGLRNLRYLGKYCKYTGIERYRYYYSKAQSLTSGFNYYYEDLNNDTLVSYGSGNVAEIIEDRFMDSIYAEEYINTKTNNIMMSQEPKIGSNFKLVLKPFDLRAEIAAGVTFHNGTLVMKYNGEFTVCSYPNWGQRFGRVNSLDFQCFDQESWDKGILSLHSDSNGRRPPVHKIFASSIPDTAEFFEIEVIWTVGTNEFRKINLD